MDKSNFYGNDYDARYQAENMNFEDLGYNVQNIGRTSKRKYTKFRLHKDNYRDS